MESIKNLATQIRGVSYKPQDLHDSLDDDSVILLRANNIDEGKINFDDVVFVDKRKVAKEQYLVAGDILICASSGSKQLVGKAASVDFDRPCTFGAFCKVIRPKQGLEKYLGVYFQSNKYRETISSLSIGANINNIRNEHIDSLVLPSYDDISRQSIVNKIEKIINIIGLRKIQLSKLDQLIKARFVEFFGMPITNIKEWKTEPMNEVAPTMNYSGTFDEKIWLLNLDMIEAQTGRIIDYLYVTKNEVGNSTCTFDTSNVLYSKLRPYLNKVVVPDRCGYATSELVPLQPVPSKLNREYLAYMLRSDEFVNMINEKVAGAKMPRVSMGDFRNFKVPIPPMELQKQFADFVKQVDKSKFGVIKGNRFF